MKKKIMLVVRAGGEKRWGCTSSSCMWGVGLLVVYVELGGLSHQAGGGKVGGGLCLPVGIYSPANSTSKNYNGGVSAAGYFVVVSHNLINKHP